VIVGKGLVTSLRSPARSELGCYGPADMGDRERIHREHFAAGAIYGTVVYLTILVLLEEDRTDAEDAVAILVGTALVFWLAHVYAHLVPRIAAEGRLRTGHFLETAGDQVGILTAVAIPVVPLILAMLGLLDDRAGLQAAVVAGVLSLAAFAVREARAAGLGWGRSLGIATVLLAAGIGLLWLEVSLH
jgi:hypothetical protein